ncbi:MAG TPA: hypothetical protein VKA15_18745, partial [Isosphaeraceae bacterium]|nr:hypothetical protein [Isosphaeraceae bacterium]
DNARAERQRLPVPGPASFHRQLVFRQFAFCVLDGDGEQVLVFRSRCGHHGFSMDGVELELFTSEWLDQGDE